MTHQRSELPQELDPRPCGPLGSRRLQQGALQLYAVENGIAPRIVAA